MNLMRSFAIKLVQIVLLLYFLLMQHFVSPLDLVTPLILSLLYSFSSLARPSLRTDHGVQKLISLGLFFAEGFLAFALSAQLGVPVYLLIWSLCFDLCLSLSLSLLIPSLGLLFGAAYITEPAQGFNLLMILALCLYSGQSLKREREKKHEAQALYDRLRISENALSKANIELEAYASSVEELTLLRERTRMSRELHDSVGHALSALGIQLKAIQTLLPDKGEQAKALVAQNSLYVDHTLEALRASVKELKPKEVEAHEGIFAIDTLLQEFKKMTGIETKIMLSNDKWPLHGEQSLHLYRIVQEALSNSLRHGKATKVSLNIQFKPELIYLQYIDNGQGTDNLTKGFGLKSMEERVKTLGGEIRYHSALGKGFELSCTIPKNYLYMSDTYEGGHL